MILVEHVTHGRSNAGGDGKGGLAVNRTVLENILKASRHANWMMSILPFLDTFSTNPNRLTGSFIPSTKSVFLLCPFL